MNQEELRKEAMNILAEHGTQTTVEQLEENISDDNAVLKLKWCLEAIEAALHKGAEREAERQKWNDASLTTPFAYEDGNWDGLRSDFVLAEKENGSYIVARVYEGKMDGTHFIDWVNDRDDLLDQPEDKIVRWKRIV